MIVLMMFVSGCAAGTKFSCPKTGSALANELDRVCPVITDINGNKASECPALDAHFAACKKLED